MKSTQQNCRGGMAVVAVARIMTLALTVAAFIPASGCTSRKQYAINETLLIDDRRRLEDELYRVQFELRDALEENERLRAKLDKDGGGAARGARRLNTTTPQRADSLRDVDDERFFPGGDALKTNGQSSNEIETLPDFVPIPSSRANAKRPGGALSPANYVNVAPPRTPNGIDQPVYEDAEASEDANATYENEYDATDEGEDDWAPIS